MYTQITFIHSYVNLPFPYVHLYALDSLYFHTKKIMFFHFIFHSYYLFRLISYFYYVFDALLFSLLYAPHPPHEDVVISHYILYPPFPNNKNLLIQYQSMPYKSLYFSLLVIHILHTSVFTSSLCSVHMEITTTSTSTGAYLEALIQVT